MRVPNSSVPLLARTTVSHQPPHRRPTYVYEEDDDEEPPPPPRSGPQSRRSNRSRRDVSPQSAHHYRSTPESRRSPRSSVSESEYETDVTMESDDERVIHPPHGKDVDMAPVSRSLMHERLNRNREAIYEEDDGEKGSRHTPSYRRRRSPSRQPSRQHSRQPSHQSSSKRDEYRRPREEYREGDMVVDNPSHYGSKRPSKTYREPEGFASKPASSVRRAHTMGGSHMASSHSLGSSTRRSTFDNAFGFPLRPSAPDKPTRLVSCIVCMDDDKPAHETVKLQCGHYMCHRCLKRNFKLSLTDPQHMPPRCCTADHIPLKHVENLFDSDFKRKWNQKFAEYSTRNRLYCPSRRCGEWIRPEDIRRDEGHHHHGKCSRCNTKVCCACNNRWHYPRACPRDVETDRFLEQARREGWQRCHGCNAVVELKEGCNHMTCSRCGGEFCMICGSKWKSCDCPWFNETLEGEPTEYMDIPMDARPNPFAGARFDGAKRFETAPSSPRDFRSDAGPPLTSTVRPRPSSYEEEMMLHRLQQRRDTQHLAHGMPPFAEPRDKRDKDRVRERPHRVSEPHMPPYQGRPMVDEYRRRPATVIVPPPPQLHRPVVPPPHSAFGAPSPGLDYAAGVGRARGMRYTSPERWQHVPSQPPSPERWQHVPSQPPSPGRERRRAPSRPQSPDRMVWHAQSRPQSPDRGRWRAPERPQSPEREWRARSVGRPIFTSPERERSPSAETHRHPSRFPSRAASRVASRAASRAASRVPSRVPSPPETRRAPSPPASRRAPSLPASRRAPSPQASRRAPSPPASRRAPSAHGTHRSPSPERRRSFTPARSRAQTPDRRRVHSPDQRRATSMERRLADRFNAEARQNSPAMMGALAPVGPVGLLGAMMRMPPPPPPPPSYAPTQPTMAPPMAMPMAPVPPPAAPPGMRRPYMMHEEEVYPPPTNRGPTRSSEHLMSSGGLTRFHEQDENIANAGPTAVNGGSPYAPHVRRRPPQATRVHGHEAPRPSVLAGLGGPGRGPNRVFEWRNYVEPGIPEGEQPPSIVAQ